MGVPGPPPFVVVVVLAEMVALVLEAIGEDISTAPTKQDSRGDEMVDRNGTNHVIETL